MSKLLFIGDFRTFDDAKLEALAVRTKGHEVSIVRGTVKDVSFNTTLSDEFVANIKRYFDFNFVEYPTMKRNFTKYEIKYIIESNDNLIHALVEDLNLAGRDDIEMLKFEKSDEMSMLENIQHSQTLVLKRVQSATEQVSDLKLLISAIMSVLTDEQKAKVEAIYSKSKKSVEETMKVSQNFINFVSKYESSVSILNAFADFEAESKIEGFAESATQVLQKLTEKIVQNFEAYMEELVPVNQILNDKAVINAVVIAYGQKIS